MDIWPGAEDLRGQICGSANAITVVLSNDVVARIKADQKRAA